MPDTVLDNEHTNDGLEDNHISAVNFDARSASAELQKIVTLGSDLERTINEIAQRLNLRPLLRRNPDTYTNELPTFSCEPGAHFDAIRNIIIKQPLQIFLEDSTIKREIDAAKTLGANNGLHWAGDPSRSLETAVAELKTMHGSKIVLIKQLLTTLRLARECQVVLASHVQADTAAAVLTGEPKFRRSTTGDEEDSSPTETYRVITELNDGLSAATRRATDINGYMQRPAATLILALKKLLPWSEHTGTSDIGLNAQSSTGPAAADNLNHRDFGAKNTGARPATNRWRFWPTQATGSHSTLAQTKSTVPDPAVTEIAIATEVVARDFVRLTLDHIDTCWRTEVLPRLPQRVEQSGPLSLSDNTADKLIDRFPLELLYAAIHKSCDDLERRLKRGGIAAYVGAALPRLSPLELVKTAIRYPMQLAALAFLALPLLAVLGFVKDGASPGALLKNSASILFPLLAVFAFWQAFLACRARKQEAIEDARRHLRSEASKTLKEVGDAIDKTTSNFLRSEMDRLKTSIFAKVQKDRRREIEERERRRNAVRAALASRLKLLDGLQQTLTKLIEDGETTTEKVLRELEKGLTTPAVTRQSLTGSTRRGRHATSPSAPLTEVP